MTPADGASLLMAVVAVGAIVYQAGGVRQQIVALNTTVEKLARSVEIMHDVMIQVQTSCPIVSGREVSGCHGCPVERHG